jgi:hypothetical protein
MDGISFLLSHRPVRILVEGAKPWYNRFMERRLPIGIQDFVSIREEGFLYVDKTARIHELATGSGRVFFLSRPRRFGKSLLCSTLGALFEGRRELFSGLAIDGLKWEWKKHPVIKIDLNPGRYEDGVERLDLRLHSLLSETALGAGLPLRNSVPEEQFGSLIKDLAEQAGQKTVVIIDEYDKPLLSTINMPDVHEKIRAALKAFYGVLKSSDAYLHMVFLTGVTKFSQVSVFSDLNNITDISFNPRFNDLCGITQEELERDFAPEIAAVLIEKQKIDILNLEQKTVASINFQKFTADTMDALAVLYQSGYLTIVDYNDEFEIYTLDYPNEEVRSAFANALLEHYIHVSAMDVNSLAVSLPMAFAKGNIEAAKQALISFLASIPYDIQLKDEKYYQTVIHLLFRMLGLRSRSEVRIAAGRIDTLVETKNHVYCFEFKLNGSAEEALAQIDSKDYLLPWEGSGKELVKVGVSFDYEKRNIRE